MKAYLNLARDLAEHFEHQADWRRQKADEFPNDAQRNLGCAEEYEKMAQALNAFEGGPFYGRWSDLLATDSGRMQELLIDETSQVYFVAIQPERLFERIVSKIEAEAAV